MSVKGMSQDAHNMRIYVYENFEKGPFKASQSSFKSLKSPY